MLNRLLPPTKFIAKLKKQGSDGSWYVYYQGKTIKCKPLTDEPVTTESDVVVIKKGNDYYVLGGRK